MQTHEPLMESRSKRGPLTAGPLRPADRESHQPERGERPRIDPWGLAGIPTPIRRASAEVDHMGLKLRQVVADAIIEQAAPSGGAGVTAFLA